MAPLRTALVGGALVAALLAPTTASAASSKGCDGGGFTLRLADGSSIKPDFKGSVAASRLPAGTRVKVVGKYVTFDVDPATFAVYDYAFTGAPNPLDQTGGRRIVVYAGKVPNHRGLALTAAAALEANKENLELSRTGTGLSMKLQAKDCANGGLFQIEPERGDGTATRFTHTLGPDAFYFDNPNFRAREGDVVPYKDTTRRPSPPASTSAPTSRPSWSPATARRSPPGSPPRTAASTPSRRRAGRAGSRASTTAAASPSGRRERRPHGRRDRRGRDRGRPTGHDLHPGLPGPEPGPRPGRRARFPVPGPCREPLQPPPPG